MASNQTTNFGLNQWEATDHVLREDFNADNAKIDAALEMMAPQIATGTFVGEGGWGADNVRRLEFSFSPRMVKLFRNTDSSSLFQEATLIRGLTTALVHRGWGNYQYVEAIKVSWEDNAVSWYSTGDNGNFSGDDIGFNAKGFTYHYAALS